MYECQIEDMLYILAHRKELLLNCRFVFQTVKSQKQGGDVKTWFWATILVMDFHTLYEFSLSGFCCEMKFFISALTSRWRVKAVNISRYLQWKKT